MGALLVSGEEDNACNGRDELTLLNCSAFFQNKSKSIPLHLILTCKQRIWISHFASWWMIKKKKKKFLIKARDVLFLAHTKAVHGARGLILRHSFYCRSVLLSSSRLVNKWCPVNNGVSIRQEPRCRLGFSWRIMQARDNGWFIMYSFSQAILALVRRRVLEQSHTTAQGHDSSYCHTESRRRAILRL